MTEQEWRTCTHPKPMFDFFRGESRNRKLRLFAVGCCRQVWNWFDGPQRETIQAAEDFADGRITLETLKVIRSGAGTSESSSRAFSHHTATRSTTFIRQAAWGTTAESAAAAARKSQEQIIQQVFRLSAPAIELVAKRQARGRQCDLVREIVGNPFRSNTFEPRRLTSTVVDLATAIYDDRAFDRMPILGDALMDAGCDNEEIIAHCRGLEPHVRGCWVVDLILGKE